MNPLRHLVLVAALVFAQLLAGAHAIEHAAGNDDVLPTHVCQLCLAAHDLCATLPSVVALPPVVAVQLLPEPLSSHDRESFPAPVASQRGPPHS